MTERQRIEETDHISKTSGPLTRAEEQALLREANQVGTPALAPAPIVVADLLPAEEIAAPQQSPNAAVTFIKRHPVASALIGLGAGYLVARSRRMIRE